MRIQQHHIPQRRVEPIQRTEREMRVNQERYEATRREHQATSFQAYLEQAKHKINVKVQ